MTMMTAALSGPIDAAASLFARHGFARTSVQAVADAAGYSKAGLLHHFPTKLALHTAVVDACRTETARVRDRVAELPLGAERDRRAIELLVDLSLARPGLVSLLLSTIVPMGDDDTAPLDDLGDLLFEAFDDAPRRRPAASASPERSSRSASSRSKPGGATTPLPGGTRSSRRASTRWDTRSRGAEDVAACRLPRTGPPGHRLLRPSLSLRHDRRDQRREEADHRECPREYGELQGQRHRRQQERHADKRKHEGHALHRSLGHRDLSARAAECATGPPPTATPASIVCAVAARHQGRGALRSPRATDRAAIGRSAAGVHGGSDQSATRIRAR